MGKTKLEYCDKCGWIKQQCTCEEPITNADNGKVVLVMDNPKECRECPCMNSCDFGVFCGATGKEIKYDYDKFEYTIPLWCPLKALPKQREIFNHCDDYLNGIDDGWNNCIDEILDSN